MEVGEVGVDVEVIGLEVRHHRHRGGEREEGAIVLVRFDDESLCAAGPEVAPPARDARADVSGGIESTGRERFGGHHGRGGLTVRPRDADQRRARRRLAERLGAPDDGKAELACAHELGMVLRHRRGDDERAAAVDVRRRVTGHDRDAPRGEVRRVLRVLVAAGDAEAAESEELGEGTHPRAGDADEMDRAACRRGRRGGS